MDVFHIEGPVRLEGVIEVSGAKNAALPIIASTILAPGGSVIKNVPRLSDIAVLFELLRSMGATVDRDNGSVTVDTAGIDNPVGQYEIVRKMRASICVLGPLLARFGRVRVAMPGGCAIGDRPVDIHIRGLRELGAHIELDKIGLGVPVIYGDWTTELREFGNPSAQAALKSG